MRAKAEASVRACVRAGPKTYERHRDLPRLVPTFAFQADAPPRSAIVGQLARKLRAERRRGRAGHWSYDLNRHIALWQALLAERRR